MTLEPLKILLVEDNATDARLVQEMLQEVRGTFDLTHVARLEAVAYQTKKRFNVILFALSLSSTQDLEAVKQLRSIYPQVPFVVMSNLNCEAIALEAVIGVQDYLIKGQTNAQLLIRTLQYAIERQRWRWEIRQVKQALQQQKERYRLLAGMTLRIRQYEEKWLSLGRVASREQEGDVMLAVNSPTDISMPYLAEVTLQDVARFRRLSEATFEGIMVHERGFVLDANQTLATMFRCEVSELIGKNVVESLATPEFQEVVRKNILSGYEKPYEVVGLRKDGSTFPIEIQGKVMPYQGRLVRVVAIRDITERKQRNSTFPSRKPLGAALTSPKLILYREIIANSNDAIAIIDSQGAFIEQNAAHRLLLGYSDHDLLGQTPALFDCEQAFSMIFEEIQRCGSYRSEVTIRSKSGALVNIELSAFVVRDNAGQPGYYVGIA